MNGPPASGQARRKKVIPHSHSHSHSHSHHHLSAEQREREIERVLQRILHRHLPSSSSASPPPGVSDPTSGLEGFLEVAGLLEREIHELARARKTPPTPPNLVAPQKKRLEDHPVYRLLQGARKALDFIQQGFVAHVSTEEYDVRSSLCNEMVVLHHHHFGSPPLSPVKKQPQPSPSSSRTVTKKSSRRTLPAVIRIPARMALDGKLAVAAVMRDAASGLRKKFLPTQGGGGVGFASAPPDDGLNVDWTAFVLDCWTSMKGQDNGLSSSSQNSPSSSRGGSNSPSAPCTPLNASFCSNGDLGSKETASNIIRTIDVATTDERHSVGKVFKEFRRRLETYLWGGDPNPARPKTIFSETEVLSASQGFVQAFSDHLFRMWRLCVDDEETRRDLRGRIEDLVERNVEELLDKVWKELFADKDQEIQEKIAVVLSKAGAPLPSPYEVAAQHLARLTTEQFLAGKLEALVESIAAVHALLAGGRKEDKEVGADVIFPIFIHCVLLSNPGNPWSTSELLATCSPNSVMKGEAGWAQATFNAALLFILSTPVPTLVTYLEKPDDLFGL